MTREEITASIARRIDALNRHDVADLTQFHADDSIVESPLFGGVARGSDAIARVYESLIRAFPDVTLRQDTLVIDGTRAVLVGTLSGTDSGGLLGQAPTHRSFSVTVVLVDDFVNGLVVHERRIYDFTGMLVQLGVVKAKPA
jgi:steroid delta-isomerase-like uncharacterized protein